MLPTTGELEKFCNSQNTTEVDQNQPPKREYRKSWEFYVHGMSVISQNVIIHCFVILTSMSIILWVTMSVYTDN